jgi:hypothetical protein
MGTPLASFPSSRNAQVPADPNVFRIAVVADTELMIAPSSDTRAYLEVRNITGAELVYYYISGDAVNGFPVKNGEYKRIINKGSVFVKPINSGFIAIDIANG